MILMLELGLISGTVKIQEYNPEWKNEFSDNRDNYAIGKNPFIENVLEVAAIEKSKSKQNQDNF
jgi:hypothetical protein